jgi:hypothetical protein
MDNDKIDDRIEIAIIFNPLSCWLFDSLIITIKKESIIRANIVKPGIPVSAASSR